MKRLAKCTTSEEAESEATNPNSGGEPRFEDGFVPVATDDAARDEHANNGENPCNDGLPVPREKLVVPSWYHNHFDRRGRDDLRRGRRGRNRGCRDDRRNGDGLRLDGGCRCGVYRASVEDAVELPEDIVVVGQVVREVFQPIIAALRVQP